MIYEHEIPDNTKLYFGKTASLKRDIENIASKILSNEGFEEIITPYFSYHQHQIIDEKNLIRVSNDKNNLISLRADSSLDVVRVIRKRLGRSVNHQKWFYIQPIFTYPTNEYYQIGAELMEEGDISKSINIINKIIKNFDINPILQISNIKIPKLIAEEFNISINIFKEGNLEEILKINSTWLKELVYITKIEDIDNFKSSIPKEIKEELEKLKAIINRIEYRNYILSPLYYAKMSYYDELSFKFINNNATICRGGSYKIEEINSTGFAIYTDALIEELSRGKK